MIKITIVVVLAIVTKQLNNKQFISNKSSNENKRLKHSQTTPICCLEFVCLLRVIRLD